ncbi:MAG: hypothetical protein ACR2QS_16845 [Woeseiaceae bacterium]
MTADLIIRNWALVISSVLAFGILFFVLMQLYRQSAKGRLAIHAAELRRLEREAAAADRRLEAAEKRLATLKEDLSNAKPRTVSEAEEAVEDARSLQKITGDQVLRAKKRVGDVILEEFTPNRQDVLRTKYL